MKLIKIKFKLYDDINILESLDIDFSNGKYVYKVKENIFPTYFKSGIIYNIDSQKRVLKHKYITKEKKLNKKEDILNEIINKKLIKKLEKKAKVESFSNYSVEIIYKENNKDKKEKKINIKGFYEYVDEIKKLFNIFLKYNDILEKKEKAVFKNYIYKKYISNILLNSIDKEKISVPLLKKAYNIYLNSKIKLNKKNEYIYECTLYTKERLYNFKVNILGGKVVNIYFDNEDFKEEYFLAYIFILNDKELNKDKKISLDNILNTLNIYNDFNINKDEQKYIVNFLNIFSLELEKENILKNISISSDPNNLMFNKMISLKRFNELLNNKKEKIFDIRSIFFRKFNLKLNSKIGDKDSTLNKVIDFNTYTLDKEIYREDILKDKSRVSKNLKKYKVICIDDDINIRENKKDSNKKSKEKSSALIIGSLNLNKEDYLLAVRDIKILNDLNKLKIYVSKIVVNIYKYINLAHSNMPQIFIKYIAGIIKEIDPKYLEKYIKLELTSNLNNLNNLDKLDINRYNNEFLIFKNCIKENKSFIEYIWEKIEYLTIYMYITDDRYSSIKKAEKGDIKFSQNTFNILDSTNLENIYSKINNLDINIDDIFENFENDIKDINKKHLKSSSVNVVEFFDEDTKINIDKKNNLNIVEKVILSKKD